jgi:hypothetical protein
MTVATTSEWLTSVIALALCIVPIQIDLPFCQRNT